MERDHESTDVEGAAHLAAEEAEAGGASLYCWEDPPSPAELAEDEEAERLRKWADLHAGGGWEADR